MACFLCPRRCGADREGGAAGVCGMTDQIKIARAAPHMWEEPPISGSRGSGTVFFSGCPLKCVFCQNRVLSADGYGKAVDGESLERIILRLAEQGVHNINLVTPTHFSDKLIPVLDKVRPKLNIPIVYNCGGYESVEALRRLEGLIDIYLPDFKYASGELAAKYSGAPDYPQVAAAALSEMHRQCGGAEFDDVIAKYGEDVTMGGNTDGAYVFKGNQDLSYEKAAFALDIGEISEPVATAEGYVVIKRLEPDTDYLKANFSSLITSCTEGQFNILVEERAEMLEASTVLEAQ